MLAPDVAGFRQPTSVGSRTIGRLLAGLILFLLALVPAAFAQEIEYYEYPGIAPGSASVRFAGERPLFYGGLQEAMEVFTKKTGIPASAVAGGCAQGAEYLKTGKANVGGFCCPLKESEKKVWTSILVARDAIPIIVHKSNPIENLTSEQVRSIWTGKIQNWKEVGGRDQPIIVVFRNHCKDREEEFRTMMLAGGGKFTQNLFPAKTVGEEMDRVSRSSASIGSIVGSAIVDMTKVKIIRVDGV
ncbi:MAG: substrate-binding domain-containing protein, partial [Nitrospirae bacterium]|nr:substrate-binding domain-containing protein [Nitrospirota bacterium]